MIFFVRKKRVEKSRRCWSIAGRCPDSSTARYPHQGTGKETKTIYSQCNKTILFFSPIFPCSSTLDELPFLCMRIQLCNKCMCVHINESCNVSILFVYIYVYTRMYDSLICGMYFKCMYYELLNFLYVLCYLKTFYFHLL